MGEVEDPVAEDGDGAAGGGAGDEGAAPLLKERMLSFLDAVGWR